MKCSTVAFSNVTGAWPETRQVKERPFGGVLQTLLSDLAEQTAESSRDVARGWHGLEGTPPWPCEVPSEPIPNRQFRMLTA